MLAKMANWTSVIILAILNVVVVVNQQKSGAAKKLFKCGDQI